VTGRDEAQARALFQERYRNTPSPLTRQIEQRVIGGDWGANGFTTMDQADTLAAEVQLSAHPHRRAVLTAGQALRAESLQKAPRTRWACRLLHHP
jgi:hypothetical protein